MKRAVLVVAFFLLGVIMLPFVPFAMAYMAAKGDFVQR